MKNQSEFEQDLSELTKTLSTSSGKIYYEIICQYLVKNLDLDCAFIGNINKNHIKVFAGHNKYNFIEEFSYSLKNSASKEIIENEIVIYPNNIQNLFPKDELISQRNINSLAGSTIHNKFLEPIAILVLISKSTLDDIKLIKHLFKIFIPSISAELERDNILEDVKNLKNIAYYDTLTKLPNRLLLNDRLSKTLKEQQREKKLVAVCLLDLDGFKNVNDTLGHDAGDFVLKEVASRVTKILRAKDTIARLGGDEFVLILSNVNHINDIANLLYRILKNLAQEYIYNGNKITYISASIGVSIYPIDEKNEAKLLKFADVAMYKAKNSGKNQFFFYNQEENRKIQANFGILNKIEKALKEEQFELKFLPKLNIRNLHIESIEALSRWNHPILGELSPNKFLPIIENDILIINFDKWVIKKALETINKIIKDNLNVTLSINIAAHTFNQNNFATIFKDIANEINFDYKNFKLLKVEINERDILKNHEHTILIINELKKLNIEIIIDNFNIEKTNLSNIKELDVKSIKIDKEFISKIIDNHKNISTINYIISVVKTFGIEIIGKCAESFEQIAVLFDLECDFVEGFAISKPLNFNDLNLFLKNFKPDSNLIFPSQFLANKLDFELSFQKQSYKYLIEQIIINLEQQNISNLSILSYEVTKFTNWLKTFLYKDFSNFKNFNKLVTIHDKIETDIQNILNKSKEIDDEYILYIKNIKEEFLNLFDQIKIEYEHLKGL